MHGINLLDRPESGGSYLQRKLAKVTRSIGEPEALSSAPRAMYAQKYANAELCCIISLHGRNGPGNDQLTMAARHFDIKTFSRHWHSKYNREAATSIGNIKEGADATDQ